MVSQQPVDWAKVSESEIRFPSEGLADRLAVWIHSNEALGRTVTVRHDMESRSLVYEAWEGDTIEDSTVESSPAPGV